MQPFFPSLWTTLVALAPCPYCTVPFLFHPKRSPISYAPPISLEMLHLTNPQSEQAFITCSTTTNIHLADKATQAWHTIRPSARFGSTHHTYTPTQWALQALSLNISYALATALTTALQDRPSSATTSNRPAPPAFRGPTGTPFAFNHRPSPYRTAASPPDPSTLASILTW
jgi:hypothetical protein